MSNNSHYVEHKSSGCESDEDEESSNTSWEIGDEMGINILLEPSFYIHETNYP